MMLIEHPLLVVKRYCNEEFLKKKKEKENCTDTIVYNVSQECMQTTIFSETIKFLVKSAQVFKKRAPKLGLGTLGKQKRPNRALFRII